jgi:serine/threonine protein kinase
LPKSSGTGEETKEEPGTPNTNNNVATTSSYATQDSGSAPTNPPTKLLAMPEVGTGGNYLDFDDNVSDYDELEDDHNEELLESRGFMKDHCFREGSPRYAVKLLRNDLDSDTKREAALDLAIEAKFLATLSHPNIIKQRGTSGVPGHSQFFIILDKLNMTLTEKRIEWREQKTRAKSGPLGLRKDKALLKTLWVERLTAAYDIARALKYLHENSIVYRDLKPDNAGYDIRQDVKVFDFGLAKELTDRDRVGLDQYKASGLTGSRRYMAPEVVLCKPYGLSVDVFSFGIFLWELLAMKEPFEDYDVHKHARLVVKKGQRPVMKSYWPQYVKQLMESCWATDPRSRPTFAQIYQKIKNFPEMRGSSLTMTERTRMLMDRSVASLYQDAKENQSA